MNKQETLEEFIKEQLEGYDEIDFSTYERFIELGVKWQQERSYSEEDLRKAIYFIPYHLEYGNIVARLSDKDIEDFIEQYKNK
jgi:hypothetical protein